MQPNVLAWEPWNALFAPESDPLRFYRAILDWADELLRPSALLFFEIHEKARPAMQDLLGTRAYQDVRILKDFRGKDRFCMARKG
jgi:release factor glutamine methyltransferase